MAKTNRRYVSLTMTSRQKDERTGERFRWTLVLSEGIAEETRRAWERRGVRVEVTRPVSLPAKGDRTDR